MTLVPILRVLLVSAAVANPPAAQPVARVLKVEGQVTITGTANKPRLAAALDTVYAGERVAVAANSELVLAFRGDGHLERVKPDGEVTVGKGGCAPKTAVEALVAPEAHRRAVSGAVRQLQAEGPVATAIVREALPRDDSSPTPEGPNAPRVRAPIDGAVVLAARPSFAWPPAAKVLGYEFHLYAGADEIWAVSIHQPQLNYTGERALQPGADYIWEVFAVFAEENKEKISGGFFTRATADQQKQAESLRELATGDDVALLTLAAVWYEENHLIAEAIAAYERLVGLAPNSAAYWSALGRLYLQADDEDKAEQALGKARRLGRSQRLRPPRLFLERLKKGQAKD